MKVLITGGAGFIGSHTVDLLLANGHSVTILDNLTTGQANNLPAGCTLVEGDIRDRGLVFQITPGHQVLVNLAAFTSVPASLDRPAECFEVNVFGMLNLLEAAVASSIKRVIFASSSAVYGEHPALPKTEGECPGPCSPYAVSKLEGEHLLEWYSRKAGLQYLALRYFNVYGPRQPADSDYASVIPAFTRAALAGQPLTIYGTGKQTRDFVYVGDVARANVLAITGQACAVLNVGTGTACSIDELASKIIELARSASTCRFAASRPGDVSSCTADITLASRHLGWNASSSLEHGLGETVLWYQRMMTSILGHG